LTYPGSTQQFGNFDDYTHALNQNVNGETWARYNDYRRTEGLGVLTLERDYLGGHLRPQIGLQFSHIGVEDYTGQEVDGAIQQETRLLSDYLAGNIIGFEGGWDNALKIGLTYDTRDFEPDPAQGMMLQATARLSMQALGSAFNYQQVAVSGRGFRDLLGEHDRLVLAGRATYTMQFGDVPFYSAPIIPFTDGDVTGLGGFTTLRGFVQNRFVGDVVAYANAELRWTMGETMFKEQHLRFMLVPFVDTGRVFDSVSDTTLEDWKFGGGLGFRLAWNVATIVSFDFGVSSEGSLFYMELGHQF
jgi:outer membrane protein assembly factor BamA